MTYICTNLPTTMHYLEKELLQERISDLEFFHKVNQSSFDGIWFWNLENPEDEWMDEVFWKTLGYDPSDKKHSPNEWQTIIHPDDKAEALKLIEKHLKNPSIPYRQLIRYRHAEGHWVFIRCSGMALTNSEGKYDRMFGVHVDVTSQMSKDSEQLLKHSQDIFLVKDSRGLVQNYNKLAAELFGFDELGKEQWPIDFTQLIHPDDLEKTKDFVHQLGESEPSGRFNNRIIDASGKTLYMEWVYIVTNGKILAIGQDVSQRVKNEKRLTRQNDLQNLMVSLANKFIDGKPDQLENILNESLREITQYVNADRGYIFDYNWEEFTTSNTYEFCQKGISPEIDNLQDVSLELFDDWVMHHRDLRKSMFIPNVDEMNEGAAKEVLGAQGITTLLAVPMNNGPKCVGFVGFDWVGREVKYNSEDENILEVFAAMIVHMRQRIQSSKELSRERFITSRLISDFKEPMLAVCPEGVVMDVNSAFVHFSGFSADELIGCNHPFPFCSCAENENETKKLQSLLNGSKSILATRLYNRDGIPKPVQVKATRILDKSGKLLRTYLSFSDRTELKRTLELLNKASDVARMGAWEISLPGYKTTYNDWVPRILGYSKNQPIRFDEEYLKVFKNHDPFPLHQKVPEYIAEQKDLSGEYRIITENEKELWVQIESNYERNAEGEVFKVFGTIQEISELKKRELELQEAKYWLDESQRVSRMGHFVIDLDDDQWEVSDVLNTVVGLTDDYPTTIEDWFAAMLPKYRNEVREEFKKAIEEQRVYRARYEWKRPIDKRIIWLEVTGEQSINDANGHRLMVGTVRDISESVQYLQSIEEQNQRLKEVAWAQSHLVRAPITRVLGLIDYLNGTELSTTDTNELLSHIQNSVLELDEMVKDIVKKTELLELESTFNTFSRNKVLKSFDNLIIHVIDDDPIVRMIHEKVVKSGLYSENPIIHADGADVIEYLKKEAGESALHLLLLDINMPGIDGWGVLNYIQSSEIEEKCAVVMLSSSSDGEDLKKSFKYSFVYDYIEKPLNNYKIEKIKSLSPIKDYFKRLK